MTPRWSQPARTGPTAGRSASRSTRASGAYVFDSSPETVLRCSGSSWMRATQIVAPPRPSYNVPMPRTSKTTETQADQLSLALGCRVVELRCSVGIRSIQVKPGFTRSRIQENALRPDAPLDFYAEDRRNMEEVFSDLMAKAPDPDVVASTVLKALGDRDPSVRYPVGREAALLARLRRFPPTSVFERSFRKQFRLD